MRWWPAAALLAAIICLGCDRDPRSVLLASGTVRDDAGPVASAIVRMRATPWFTMTDADGRFTLSGIAPAHPFAVTASASGYYIGGGDQQLVPGTRGLEITLVRHPSQDEVDYEWLSATTAPGMGEAQACVSCHSAAGTDAQFRLPVDEWLEDAHAGSAQNQRFLTMYGGTNLAGNQSPPTRFGTSRDYGRFPLPPDETQPYYGPGYALDFPESAGNCAACHVPVAAVNDPFGIDPRTVSGVALEGVTCDFCHKISDVRVDADTLLPSPSLPGVLSYAFLRPPEGYQYFAGPFDDVAPGEDVYSPLQRESQFCAGCHSGTFWDVPIYDSYREWLASPYADPETGRTCQSCHMPSSGTSVFALAEMGGQVRDPLTIAGHRMPGVSDVLLLQNSVTMTVEASRRGERESTSTSRSSTIRPAITFPRTRPCAI
jgi:mono/diheme cytochrome c family protein